MNGGGAQISANYNRVHGCRCFLLNLYLFYLSDLVFRGSTFCSDDLAACSVGGCPVTLIVACVHVALAQKGSVQGDCGIRPLELRAPSSNVRDCINIMVGSQDGLVVLATSTFILVLMVFRLLDVGSVFTLS